MFERPAAGERAVLVHLDIGGRNAEDDEREEFRLLAQAAGGEVAAVLGGSRQVPDPRYFIGSGKVEELKQLVEAHQADLVIFNHPLSPAQERNLERQLQCRVVDRSGLILDIFAQRARSFEGKLQVELAQLRHLSTRLVRGWTHLERQKGGIGLRGPGESQLETDRRLLGKRVVLLERRLEKIESQRALGRRARDKAEVSVVSLVGYTNAGKSTLFNRLTEAGVFQADQLFATLDPTLRRLDLAGGQHVLLADTVGFVSDLPHELVAAFRSTLEEARNASLLLHVIDATAPHRQRLMSDVESVLTEIGCGGIPRLEVFNKIDQLPDVEPHVERDDQGVVQRVWMSAASGAGVEALLEAIAERTGREPLRCRCHLAPENGRLHALLYEYAEVLVDRPLSTGGWEMEILVERADFERLCARNGEIVPLMEEIS